MSKTQVPPPVSISWCLTPKLVANAVISCLNRRCYIQRCSIFFMWTSAAALRLCWNRAWPGLSKSKRRKGFLEMLSANIAVELNNMIQWPNQSYENKPVPVLFMYNNISWYGLALCLYLFFLQTFSCTIFLKKSVTICLAENLIYCLIRFWYFLQYYSNISPSLHIYIYEACMCTGCTRRNVMSVTYWRYLLCPWGGLKAWAPGFD